VFFHKRNIVNGPVDKGDRVTFEIGPDPAQPGKFRASRVALEKRHE